MPKNDGLDPERKKLRKLLKGFRVAMLTTVSPEGALRSRPMATVRMAPGDGDVWFLTKVRTPKVGEVEENQRVNVAYGSAEDGCYVSLSGTASLVRDPERVLMLWRKRLRKWFPEGKNDPELAALRVRVDRAEYWDDATGTMMTLLPQAGPHAAPATPPSQPNDQGAAGRIADAMKALVTGSEQHEEDKPQTPGGAQG